MAVLAGEQKASRPAGGVGGLGRPADTTVSRRPALDEGGVKPSHLVLRLAHSKLQHVCVYAVETASHSSHPSIPWRAVLNTDDCCGCCRNSPTFEVSLNNGIEARHHQHPDATKRGQSAPADPGCVNGVRHATPYPLPVAATAHIARQPLILCFSAAPRSKRYVTEN